MPWLVGGAFVLWATLGWRAFVLLAPGRRGTIADLVSDARDRSTPRGSWNLRDQAIDRVVSIARSHTQPPHAVVDEALLDIRGVLGDGRVLVRTLVVLAPLAGLLGTVTGMIETFDSLGNMVLFARSGGIAGGIAQALVSTQMGLSVAIPGVLVARWLSMKQRKVESLIDETEASLATEAAWA